MSDVGDDGAETETPPAAMAVPEGDQRQDLYFGLVRAIGTDLNLSVAALTGCLERAGYRQEAIHHLKLSRFLPQLEGLSSREGAGLSSEADGRYRYYESRMDAGDRARSEHGDDVLGLLAVNEVRRHRVHASEGHGRFGDVFIFDSLMHPEEVALLRSVYGKRFFLIAVHSAAADREAALLADLRASDPAERVVEDESQRSGDASVEAAAREAFEARERARREQVSKLVERDEGLPDVDTPRSPVSRGRRVAIRKTFALADVFVSSQEVAPARDGDQPGVLERFIRKIFDEPFLTPTRAELGMAHAYVAARRSGSLARNVGAVITTDDGELLAVGTNEVPAAGGGQYWPLYDGADHDHRDFRFAADTGINTVEGRGQDSNDAVKLGLVHDLVARVLQVLPEEVVHDAKQRELFEAHIYQRDDVVQRLMSSELVGAAQVFDVIEYSRQVHAEMAAIVSCARRGIPTAGAVLYCTTFPCHECSRHVVAAGISRVVYIEPYPKSKVAELHSDSVTVELFTGHPEVSGEAPPPSNRVAFEPFIGISPDRHADLYSPTRRKAEAPTTDPELVGRARFWTFGPGSPLRSSLTAGSTAIGTGEALRIIGTETYVRALVSEKGLESVSLQAGLSQGSSTVVDVTSAAAPDAPASTGEPNA
jgi:deoxycytidylate deaminase